MKKTLFTLLIILTFLSSYWIYNQHQKKVIKLPKINKLYPTIVSNQYNLVNINEAKNIINNESGILIICHHNILKCNDYMKDIDNILRNKYPNINVNYLNIKTLDDELTTVIKRKTGIDSTISLPMTLFIKNKQIVDYDILINHYDKLSSYFKSYKLQ